MKKLIILFAVIITLISALKIYSQVTQEWVQRYNVPGNFSDEAGSVAVDNNGNVYLTGKSFGPVTNSFLTIKYNSVGVLQWEQKYDSADQSYPLPKLAIDNFGNVYITGSALINGINCATTIKYNSEGAQLWSQNFLTAGSRAIVVDNIGNVYVAGSSDSLSNECFITIKYNSSGNEQWHKKYVTDSTSGGGMSLDVDNSGNVYVTGYSYVSTVNSYIATLKYNSTGVEQWARLFGTGNTEFSLPRELTVDNSGNVFIAGETSDTVGIIKYNTSGILQWATSDGGAYSLCLDKSGNIYAAYSIYTEIFKIEIKKYNSAGIRQWIESFDGNLTDPDGIVSMAMDSLENVYICCPIYDSIGNNSDYKTVKYNSEGDSQWVQIYSGPANSYDDPKSIAVDNSGNVYVSGYSTGIGTGRDYTAIKYSQVTGIHPVPNEIAKHYKLEQNYPNPFNPVTVIRYSLIENGFVSLKVYDLLGKEVAALVNEKHNAGSYEIEFNAGNLSSGVYFYKLATDGFTDTKRMTLLK